MQLTNSLLNAMLVASEDSYSQPAIDTSLAAQPGEMLPGLPSDLSGWTTYDTISDPQTGFSATTFLTRSHFFPVIRGPNKSVRLSGLGRRKTPRQA